jgi:hypothetical protein
VTAENSSIEWGMLGSTSTLSNVSTQTLTSFFQPLSPYGQIFDPHTLYDATNGRFVVVADEANNSFSKSSLLVAVSEDANPADGWYFQSINSAVKIANRSTWADYPKIAVDGTNIVISTNQFTSSGSYLGAEQYVLQDFAGTNGGLYKGGASTVTTLRWSNAYSSVEEVSAPGAGGTYALSYTGNGIAVTFNPTQIVG